MEEKKTHRLVEKPKMSARFLADYMAASDQARRTILRGCKYRAIARIVQHDDAKLAITKYLLGSVFDPSLLDAEAEYVRSKIYDSDFERDCNEINADYIDRFAKIVENLELPKNAQWISGKNFPDQEINGLKVSFAPNLLVSRPGKKNLTKVGAMMLRYKKGSNLSEEVACFQSSIIHGMMSAYGVEPEQEVDLKICFTMDAHSGVLHCAPTNAISRFNNVKAACATIAEVWDNIRAPTGAVL